MQISSSFQQFFQLLALQNPYLSATVFNCPFCFEFSHDSWHRYPIQIKTSGNVAMRIRNYRFVRIRFGQKKIGNFLNAVIINQSIDRVRQIIAGRSQMSHHQKRKLWIFLKNRNQVRDPAANKLNIRNRNDVCLADGMFQKRRIAKDSAFFQNFDRRLLSWRRPKVDLNPSLDDKIDFICFIAFAWSTKKRTVKRLSEWASITQLTREPHNPLGILLL